MTEAEIKAQAEEACIMIDKNDRACYVAGYLGGYNATIDERLRLRLANSDLENKNTTLSQKVYDLQKAYDRQIEATNKLNQENTELKERCTELFLEKTSVIDINVELRQETAELKKKLKPENCLKSLAKSGLVKFTCENVNEHDQLTKAKELLNEFMRISKASDEDFEHDYSELIGEAEQFLKEESITEQTNECHDCAKFDEMPKGPRCKTCDNGSHFQKKEEA